MTDYYRPQTYVSELDLAVIADHMQDGSASASEDLPFTNQDFDFLSQFTELPHLNSNRKRRVCYSLCRLWF